VDRERALHPTPWEMARTVKLRAARLPGARSHALERWSRSRPPSATLMCTRTVSPARKDGPGLSSLALNGSQSLHDPAPHGDHYTMLVATVTRTVFTHPVCAVPQDRLRFVVERGLVDEVGPAEEGAPERLPRLHRRIASCGRHSTSGTAWPRNVAVGCSADGRGGLRRMSRGHGLGIPTTPARGGPPPR